MIVDLKKISHVLFGHPDEEFETGQFYARCHGCRGVYRVMYADQAIHFGPIQPNRTGHIFELAPEEL